jgi:Zn ribbon nucleic-acid-binding protein
MKDSIFLLRCVDCDALGYVSRLWLRTSIQVSAGRRNQVHHYVECMNCGARLKSRHRDLMESVNDDEWQRFVGDELARPQSLPTGMQRIH